MRTKVVPLTNDLGATQEKSKAFFSVKQWQQLRHQHNMRITVTVLLDRIYCKNREECSLHRIVTKCTKHVHCSTVFNQICKLTHILVIVDISTNYA